MATSGDSASGVLRHVGPPIAVNTTILESSVEDLSNGMLP